jgi:signal transduction histidine kinase
MEAVQGTSIEQGVIDLFPAGIILFNPDGSKHTINQAAQTIVRGLCSPELIRSWDDFLLFFNIEKIPDGNELSRIEKTIAGKTYVVYPQQNTIGGEIFRIIYIADITQEKKLIEEIHKTTSSILMGIRTRVTGIQNALGLLLDYNLSPGESAGLVRDSRYEIWLLARYADNLKDVSLSQAGALADTMYLQPLSLFRIIKEAVSNTAIFRSYHQNEVPIRSSVPNTISVRCDRIRMVEVIESLLLNSLIYAGPGNEIDIDATLDDTWVVLTIRDRGFGIPLEDQQHIFEYRFRGKNKNNVKYNGMGIELYLAKLNCTFQEATLSFSSKEGAGACFEIAIKRDYPQASAHTKDL